MCYHWVIWKVIPYFVILAWPESFSKIIPLAHFTKGNSEGFPTSGNDNYWSRIRYEVKIFPL